MYPPIAAAARSICRSDSFVFPSAVYKVISLSCTNGFKSRICRTRQRRCRQCAYISHMLCGLLYGSLSLAIHARGVWPSCFFRLSLLFSPHIPLFSFFVRACPHSKTLASIGRVSLTEYAWLIFQVRARALRHLSANG